MLPGHGWTRICRCLYAGPRPEFFGSQAQALLSWELFLSRGTSLTFCSQDWSSGFRKAGFWSNARARAVRENTWALVRACTSSATRFCPWLYGAAADAGEAASRSRSTVHHNNCTS